MPGDLTFLEGGEPIVVDGDIVGAVGVSGVKSVEDARSHATESMHFLKPCNEKFRYNFNNRETAT